MLIDHPRPALRAGARARRRDRRGACGRALGAGRDCDDRRRARADRATARRAARTRWRRRSPASASSRPRSVTSCARRSPGCARRWSSRSIASVRRIAIAQRSCNRSRSRSRPSASSRRCCRSRGSMPVRRSRTRLRSISISSCATCCRRSRRASAERKIELVTELEPITLTTDRDKLRLVFVNLFDNAVTYADDGGEIRVDADRSRAAREQHRVRTQRRADRARVRSVLARGQGARDRSRRDRAGAVQEARRVARRHDRRRGARSVGSSRRWRCREVACCGPRGCRDRSICHAASADDVTLSRGHRGGRPCAGVTRDACSTSRPPRLASTRRVRGSDEPARRHESADRALVAGIDRSRCRSSARSALRATRRRRKRRVVRDERVVARRDLRRRAVVAWLELARADTDDRSR